MIRDTSLGELIAFVSVARLGSFALAADELLVTQSALSKRIKKLESSIGAPLLDRTTRSVSVSTLGREFLPKAKRIIEDYDRSLNDMSELVKVRKGVVALSCNMTLSDTLLPEIIERFKTFHPDIRVKVHEDSSPQAIERVLSGQSEIAFGTLGKPHPDLEFEQLIDDPFVIACHKSHPLASSTSTTWEDVKNQHFILLRPESSTRKLLQSYLDTHYDALSNDIQVGHFHSQLSLVARGIGIAATPSLIRLSRRDLDIAIIPISEPTISRKLGIVTYKGRALSPAAEELRRVAASVMQSADG